MSPNIVKDRPTSRAAAPQAGDFVTLWQDGSPSDAIVLQAYEGSRCLDIAAKARSMSWSVFGQVPMKKAGSGWTRKVASAGDDRTPEIGDRLLFATPAGGATSTTLAYEPAVVVNVRPEGVLDLDLEERGLYRTANNRLVEDPEVALKSGVCRHEPWIERGVVHGTDAGRYLWPDEVGDLTA
jgi:hypothetical protein